jgi:endonuclease/exonuclease/phosphatase family metal-dependent hydrolase
MRKLSRGRLSVLLGFALSAFSTLPGITLAAEPLKIMTFNIWLGGDQVNFEKTIEAIKASGAEIVALQEAEGRSAEIAHRLGWSQVAGHRNIIAKYPLFAPPTGDAGDGNDLNYLYAEMQPGKFVTIANIHLPSSPYGPYDLRDGKAAEEVLATEAETQLAALQPYIEPLKKAAESGTPAIILGDFNTPSWLDWTEATIGRQDYIKNAMPWPATKALADAGFTDAYRAVHQDPKAKPGITWSYGYPYPHLDANEALDRIDMIHVVGPVTVKNAEILGDPGMPDTDIAVRPWPSDHRALVATLEVEPGPAPAMVSPLKKIFTIGEAIDVRFHAATDDGRLEDARVVIFAADGDPATPLVSLPGNDGTDRSNLSSFGSSGLAPGAYIAALVDAEGKELARAPFWMKEEGQLPGIATDKSAYASGEAINVTWVNGPGNRFDWIGIFAKDDPADDNYLYFFYTGGGVPSGMLTLDEAMLGAKLEPGDYDVRLMRDDGYTRLAGASFTVK